MTASRIERVYFEILDPSFNDNEQHSVYSLQTIQGCVVYIERDEIINFRLRQKDSVILLQFDIPEHLQEKVFTDFNLTKGRVDGIKTSFFPQYMTPKELLNYDYYSGYWECSRKSAENRLEEIFNPCHASVKADYPKFLALSCDLKKIENKISEKKYVLGFSLVLSIGTLAMLPQKYIPSLLYPVVIGGLAYMARELYLLNERAGNNRKSINIILSNHPIFSNGMEKRKSILELENVISRDFSHAFVK